MKRLALLLRAKHMLSAERLVGRLNSGDVGYDRGLGTDRAGSTSAIYYHRFITIFLPCLSSHQTVYNWMDDQVEGYCENHHGISYSAAHPKPPNGTDPFRVRQMRNLNPEGWLGMRTLSHP